MTGIHSWDGKPGSYSLKHTQKSPVPSVNLEEISTGRKNKTSKDFAFPAHLSAVQPPPEA